MSPTDRPLPAADVALSRLPVLPPPPSSETLPDTEDALETPPTLRCIQIPAWLAASKLERGLTVLAY